LLACSRLAEPPDHAIGRSRGGLTSKLHTLVDGKGRPLVLVVSAGQVNDSPVFPTLLDQLQVPRIGPGRARSRPDVLIADKAYSARAHRTRLRAAKVKTVIPEPADQIAHRQRRGPRGGRPPAFDAELYRRRNVIERGYNTIKQWRGLATRYDNHALHWRGGAVLRATLIWAAALGDTP
jgi:putative transposase